MKKANTVHQSNPFKAQPMEEWQIATLEEGCPPRITFLTRGNFHALAYFARRLCGEYWLLVA